MDEASTELHNVASDQVMPMADFLAQVAQLCHANPNHLLVSAIQRKILVLSEQSPVFSTCGPIDQNAEQAANETDLQRSARTVTEFRERLRRWIVNDARQILKPPIFTPSAKEVIRLIVSDVILRQTRNSQGLATTATSSVEEAVQEIKHSRQIPMRKFTETYQRFTDFSVVGVHQPPQDAEDVDLYSRIGRTFLEMVRGIPSEETPFSSDAPHSRDRTFSGNK
jgi:hypothetical protein